MRRYSYVRDIGLFLCAWLPGIVLGGDVFRWQDAQGRWHFGDQANAPEAATIFELSQEQNWLSMTPSAPFSALLPTKGVANEQPQLDERRMRQKRCLQWREQMNGRGLQARALQDRYDRECVLQWRR